LKKRYAVLDLLPVVLAQAIESLFARVTRKVRCFPQGPYLLLAVDLKWPLLRDHARQVAQEYKAEAFEGMEEPELGLRLSECSLVRVMITVDVYTNLCCRNRLSEVGPAYKGACTQQMELAHDLELLLRLGDGKSLHTERIGAFGLPVSKRASCLQQTKRSQHRPVSTLQDLGFADLEKPIDDAPPL